MVVTLETFLVYRPKQLETDNEQTRRCEKKKRFHTKISFFFLVTVTPTCMM